jgi:ABC-2 type transport system permease protein
VRGFVATAALVRFVLRRDRIRLPVWIGSILVITYASAQAVTSTYDTPTEIASYAHNLGNSPATIAMAGPPVALNQIGGILVYETSLTALLGTALMAAFTVVRHTRGEEEEGRTELLVSTVVGRHAGAAAAVLVAAAASVLVGLGVSGSVLAAGMPAHGAWLYGAAVAALGLVFAAVAGVAAQLMSHGRAATGFVLAVLAVAFLLRAVGDVRESGLSWLSPIGWSQQVRVLDENRWWPLLLSLAATLVLLAATVLLATRRDVGSGIVPARPGPTHAAAGLRSPLALAWRLQRGSVLAWAVGVFALGAMFGSLSQEMQNMVRDNPTLAQYFEVTGGSVTDALFGSALLFNALGAAAFAVGSALRLRHSETAGTLEPVLATGVSRTRAMLEPLVVTVAGSVLLLLVGAFGAALAWAGQSGEVGPALRLVGLALVYTPAVLVLVGLAVVLTGLLPRLTLVAWVGVALAFVVGWLGGLLDLPGWVSGLSPLDHVPLVPVDDVRLAPLLVLSAIAGVLGAGGLWGFHRRDVT